MPKAYAMITNGTEEVECLAVVDILRRAGVETVLVSAEDINIVGSHGIRITADACLKDVDFADADLVFVPGGLVGSKTLGACKPLVSGLKDVLARGDRVAAVCAAPALVLGANGLLDGRRAICYPGFEQHMLGAALVPGAAVVTDCNITTARGLGCSLELGLELVRQLVGVGVAEELRSKIQLDRELIT